MTIVYMCVKWPYLDADLILDRPTAEGTLPTIVRRLGQLGGGCKYTIAQTCRSSLHDRSMASWPHRHTPIDTLLIRTQEHKPRHAQDLTLLALIKIIVRWKVGRDVPEYESCYYTRYMSRHG